VLICCCCCCVKLLDEASGLLVLNLLMISGSEVWSESFFTSSISAVAIVGDGLFLDEVLLHNCIFFDGFSSLRDSDSLGSKRDVIEACGGVGLKL
jgi:hypothetical protein